MEVRHTGLFLMPSIKPRDRDRRRRKELGFRRLTDVFPPCCAVESTVDGHATRHLERLLPCLRARVHAPIGRVRQLDRVSETRDGRCLCSSVLVVALTGADPDTALFGDRAVRRIGRARGGRRGPSAGARAAAAPRFARTAADRRKPSENHKRNKPASRPHHGRHATTYRGG